MKSDASASAGSCGRLSVLRFMGECRGVDAAAATAQTSQLPLEAFTNSVDVGEMKISPDGKYIAFTTGEDAEVSRLRQLGRAESHSDDSGRGRRPHL